MLARARHGDSTDCAGLTPEVEFVHIGRSVDRLGNGIARQEVRAGGLRRRVERIGEELVLSAGGTLREAGV
jgi:hypothetical protein